MDDAKLECFIPRGVEGVAVRRFGSAIGAVDWAAYYLLNEDNEIYRVYHLIKQIIPRA